MKKTLKKAVETTVKQVLNGEYDDSVFNQLCAVCEHVARNNFSVEEKAATFPLYKDYSNEELCEIREKVAGILLEKLEKDEFSYLQTLRVIIALELLDPCLEINPGTDKIRICYDYWNLCLFSDEELGITFQKIHVFDTK